MNPRVYLLALASFVAGCDENLVGGILPLVAQGLNVSVSAAGQLTSAFSLTFALCAAPLLALTGRFERRRLLIGALAVFALGNLGAALAPSYVPLMRCRIVSAVSCALIVVLASTLAASLVEPSHKGRAIGIVFVGISGSLVLGIPLGIVLGDAYGWRAPFLLLAALAALLAPVLGLSLPRFAVRPSLPLSAYLTQLAVPRRALAQAVSVLLIGGHFVLFAYLAPYSAATLGIKGDGLSLLYLLFGAAAVCGGYLGGWLSDRLGAPRALWLIPALFTVVLAALPWASCRLVLFLPLMAVWSALSWTISPAMQNYLIQNAPGAADANVGINTSAMHLGVALGSALGGLVIAGPGLAVTPWAGAVLAALAWLAARGSVAAAQQPAIGTP
jgi:DHA1 family purine base/nucleoside efflux pump-like MFS transporter